MEHRLLHRTTPTAVSTRNVRNSQIAVMVPETNIRMSTTFHLKIKNCLKKKPQMPHHGPTSSWLQIMKLDFLQFLPNSKKREPKFLAISL